MAPPMPSMVWRVAEGVTVTTTPLASPLTNLAGGRALKVSPAALVCTKGASLGPMRPVACLAAGAAGRAEATSRKLSDIRMEDFIMGSSLSNGECSTVDYFTRSGSAQVPG
jgi:hypothetical protein